MLPFHLYADLFPLIEGADFDALVADIQANDLREKIVVWDGAILDGRNRYRAALSAGLLDEDDGPDRSKYFTRFVVAVDGDPLAFVISKNLRRRHLNESQRAMAAAKIANLSHGGDRRSDQAANLPLENSGGAAPSRCAGALATPLPQGERGTEGMPAQAPSPVVKVDQVSAARMLNVSERLVRAAKAVQASGSPELQRAVEQGHLAVSAAAQAAKLAPYVQAEIAVQAATGKMHPVQTVLKRAVRAERERSLGEKQLALPDKKYGVIYADPEWEHKNWSENGMLKAAANHYPTSPTDEIAARDIPSIAATDCVLFLWGIVPMLPDALRVMTAWGFEYKSHAVWRKRYPGRRQGTGFWFRVDHEILLVGRRGKVVAPAPGTQLGSVIEADWVGRHSAKPALFAEHIERLYPTLPKIELNRRGPPRPGWDAWGNEAEVDYGENCRSQAGGYHPRQKEVRGFGDAGVGRFGTQRQARDVGAEIGGREGGAAAAVAKSQAKACEVEAVQVSAGSAETGMKSHAGRLAAGRTAAATSERMDVTAGETTPELPPPVAQARDSLPRLRGRDGEGADDALDIPSFLRRGADNAAPFAAAGVSSPPAVACEEEGGS